MRRKITAAKLEAAGDLPKLTAQQQLFVEGLLAGKNASDAFRAAYDCSNYQPNSIWARASALRADDKVGLWLSAARQAHLGSAKVTVENHLAELERLKEIALATGNVGAAVQAEQLRGKVRGHYTEQVSLKVDDPVDSLKEIAKISPELATFLAQQNKLDEWQDKPTAH